MKKKLPIIAQKAERALKRAVHKAILDHARTGDSVVIWKNGRIVEVPAKKLLVRERSAKYRTKNKK